jgi:hypothetical protein
VRHRGSPRAGGRLRQRRYPSTGGDGGAADGRDGVAPRHPGGTLRNRSPRQDRRPRVTAMKKLLVLIVVVALAAFAVKKLQDA